MEGDDISQTDKRITWMIQRVAAAHKPWVKPKDLERLEEDEPCIVFKDFLDHKETSALFVVYTGQVLQLLLEPPADFKARKVLYFVKREAKQVKPENISRLVQFGELHPNPLESLLYTESHINPALLKVEENVAQVAEVARPQLNDKMDGFRSGLLVTQGLAEGKSRLPLPTLVDLSQRDRDKEIVYQLESVVVGWISQMRHAIAASPSTLFESSHPDTRGTPSALHEIKFWRQKCDDLRGLEVQLSSPAVLKLLSILKNADSSYYRPFVQLQEELHQSSLEASSNLRFLEPLCDGQDSPFMLLAGHPAVSFDELVEAKVFEKILHHIFLLWEYSKYYNTVPRLVVLFREICNDIIESARLFINSSELFQLDAEDASHRLSICLATCTHFKSIYFKVKQRTNSASRRGPWKLHNSIFLRLDRFLERCDDLLDVLETATLFGRLDPEMGRVIVGGTHGAEACSVIGTVYTDFVSLHRDFYDCGIDLLDVEDTRFDDIYTDFRQKTKQLEQKLGTLFVTSLQDSHTLANLFKVVDSFDGFLGRALIHQEWQQRQMDVIRTYHEDLLATQECFTATVSRDRRLEDPRGFQRQLVATAGANGSMFPQKPGAAFDKQGADIYDRMPPTTARVIWARSLLSRIEQPLLKMNELISPAVQQSEQWKTTAALVAVLQGTINQYIQSQLGTWVGGIDGAQKKLELSLLEKRDDGAVQVNFDKELSKLLREVTYIEGIEECDGKAKDASKVPTSTQSTLADPAGLRSQVYKLEAVCRQYNEMRATVLPMEQAIFAEEFAHCEDLLASGMRNLTWHDASVGRWVASVSATVGDLSAAIGGLRDAVAAVEKALRQFTAEDTFLPLDPKEAKTMPCDEFSRRFAEYNAGRRGKAAAKSTEARRVCAAAFAAVNDFKARRSSPIAPLDENDPPWRAFVSHVNSCCEALVVACVEHALANLRNQLSGEWLSEQSGIPLLDIKLTIDTKANPVRGDFAPPLTQANTRHTGVTLESLVETWIDDCKQYAGVFQTLDDTGRTFSSAVAGHTRCEELAREILLQVGASIDECRAFQRQFDGFAYLWETQLDSVFQKFIDDHTPDLAEASESQLQLQQPPPEDAEITVESFERTFFSGASLDDYSAEISRYNRVQDAIGSLPDGQQCSWLRIDAKPMKIALRDCCAKWRSVFVNHLVDKTRSELDSLYSFVKTAESELEIQVTSLDDLKSVMKWVRECKQLNPKVEIMFEPMGQVIAMLKRQACISDDLVAELENLRRDGPETWLALHKKSLNIREEYSKMQDQEADRVEEEAQEFLEVLSSFAAMFDNTGAFSYLDDTDAAYTEMDHIHLELLGRETESSRFNSEQALFDLEKTDFRLLKECRQKLRLLKGIWDLIAHVRATFAFWYETPFMAVDVEELSDEVTKLLKQLKSQPTKTKSWPCFEGLQADVKRMSMSLPLIQDLREEAVRDRHWVQLLRETDHANLSIDPRSTSCTLLDLLSLSLHEHQDIVQNTVEKATKELQLETNLNRVATTWNAQKFTYEYDDNLAAWTLGKVDDISDELDSDTNLLQQMQSNRFVAYFQEPVAKWMDNLGKIESTLLIWLDAQKRWTNLYPIFVKSQDIRVSLPDDAKVFESADELYREMMDKIRHHENVVSVCCSDLLKKVLERDDDIEEVLGIVLDVLRQCEKALADYLESKKRLFPRFFFLADADLVDILSKGSQPKEIMTHMSKIVDAVDTFNFLPDRPSTVHGIVSIQGEKVPLAYEYTCQGAVEDWLSGCIDVVRASIKAKIDEANSSYMEQPRISWIFNCCCQAVIVASRLQFTWETNSAFAQLEDGNELAMKDHMQLQQKQLSEEIRLVLGELSTNDRSMLVHLITIDVHNRDIIQWLIDEKAENDTHFTWQSQLRYLWHEAKGVVIKICDSEFVDEELKGRLRVACAKLQLFAGENDTFVEKCLQFDELLRVRHSVFVLGPAGCGKTECRNALRAAFLQEAGGCKVRAMNPKAITANEMYGTTHEQTKEWREGHLAHIFKEFSVLSKTNTCRKWIVLDGIIDAEWIESMNTVMDDNKMLTLANNDRIPLTPSMRMVFEISQLQNASPATVSRAGILYINDVDVGWNPFVDRWLLSREDEREHNYLDSFFDSYLPSVFEQLKKGIATVVQIADISLVQTLCALLDALLHNVPHGSPQEVYEKYFCFALVWAFGGALASDGRVDYRAAFSKWWVREMQSRVRICDEKYQVFDFYISKETHHEFCSWNELVAKYKTDPDLPMSEQLVETAETVRMQQMLQLLMTQQHPVLLVGMAGTGKSKIVLSKLAGLDSTNWMTRHTSFNAKTTARTFQLVLEANLERSGRKWHPPGRKKLVFFMDDLNMPLPDKYGTQEPIALLRQYLDYGFWFDRGSPGVEKHVAGIQLVASMNHKAGSFTILDRALRWFSVFALSMPGGEDLTTIYQSLLAAHVRSWSSHVRNLVPILVNATVELLQAMREQFLPTAAKFHYHWNLREVSNVFQGLTSTMRALHDGDAILFIRLWKHECERVFRDRMVDEHETAEYDSLCAQVVTKYFSDVVVVDDVLREPNLWAPFGQHGDEIDIYDQIDSFEQLSVFLEGKLDEYNEDTTRARMDLVLFNQAMEHQLVVLNDMLNSGNVPNLFEPEVADEITHAMLPELRQRQHPDYHNKEVCWKYFISKVQANLHTVLCFSPVGQQLATWCRHFPALATTTVIDWFHSWAPEALFSVSRRFLSAPDFALSGESSLVDACASSISETHLFVTSLADEYKAKNRRYCYTTPKSFMELISTYKNMLRDKRLQQAEKTRRLVDGIHKIKLAKDSVHELQVKLKDEDTEVRMASQEVATLMEQVSTDKAAIQEEAERAEVEKKKTEKLVTETDALKAEAERDLAAAQPLVERAKAALKSLNKASLTELKSFTKPPQEVLMVTAAVMCLTAHPNRIPRPEIAKDWSNAKKMMSNISQWLKELEDFGANMSNDIPQPCIDAIQVWVRDPNFDAECMKSKSEAASCLSAWVSNMDAYHTLRCQVRPKEEKLQEARERLEVSKSQFQAVQDHVTNLNNKLNALVEAHNTASEKSRILKEKVESTRLKMNIAERLVSGLADENIRWSRTVEELREGMHQLVGDVLVAAAFISYAGPFSSEYRERLIDHLNKDVQMRRIPHMEGQDVVTGILTSEAEVAAWNNEGLPTDRISTENGAIVKTAKRWPLLIDPQLQGITWIKAKEASHGLVVTQQGNTRYLDDVIHCLQMGLPCLIQNLPETIDPILDPILSKEFARKGTSYTCKVGDKDVDVNISTFRLYLQTKHPNPHYKPELNAQTTLVNFMVTESGLEDQLLAVVVNMERPELEERRAALIRQMNQYKIDLSSCEDKLLIELSNAEGDLLENVVLITNLEDTKKQAGMIAKALIDDRVTQEELMEQRLVYKPAATRGSLIFFEIDRLAKINSIY
eukprot:gene3564-5529_t